MKLAATVLFSLVTLFCSPAAAQDLHNWKPLVVNDEKKVWYDGRSFDDAHGDKFEVWLLQMHVPPLKMDGIKGEVYRAQTLYAVDLSSVKYGIEKVIYFDQNNKEIYRFDYKINNYEDKLKYTYPVLENSSIHLVIKELFKYRAEQTN